MRTENKASALVAFSFTSRLADGLPASVVLRLARDIERANYVRGLTGELRIVRKSITQVVEGPWPIVMPLVARILTDPRHRDIAIDFFEAIPARSHTGWSWSAPDREISPHLAASNLRMLPYVRARLAEDAFREAATNA